MTHSPTQHNHFRVSPRVVRSVVMAVASFIHLLLSISISLLLANISSSLKCSGKNVLRFSSDRTCVYPEIASNTTKVFDYKWAEGECRRLNEGRYLWHPPTMRDKVKPRMIAQHLRRNDTTSAAWIFWLGLMRDEATEEEGRNLEIWKDPKRWRLVADNSSLTTTAFWKFGKEPDNMAFISSNDSEKMERCVWAVTARKYSEYWGDVECAVSLPTRNFTIILVCETVWNPAATKTTTAASKKIPSTTTTASAMTIPMTSPTPTTTPADQKPSTSESESSTEIPPSNQAQTEEPSISWHWWLLGSCIGLFLICLAILFVVCCIVNRKRDHRGRYENLERSRSLSLQSGESGRIKSNTSFFTSFFKKINPSGRTRSRSKGPQVRDQSGSAFKRKTGIKDRY